VLEDCPCHRRNLRQAFVASVHWTAFDPVMLVLLFTLAAIGHAVRESLFPEVLKASLIIRKLAVEIFDCVPKVTRNRLSAVHDA
jgi:hypothetical protein